ncbi:MAG: HAD family hydrolase [Caldilineaceae bacterium]|nr:HAD family hydrolase [Caldilineaceae bacterium]
MANWMAALAAHYRAMHRQYPQDQLMVIFDIDGTILDLRYMMLYLLQRYDREHGTQHFTRLALTDIDVHEAVMDRLLARLGLDEAARTQIEGWYLQRYWSSETIAASHCAFDQVFDVISWLQRQPNLTVALNTGREEFLRADTLLSLNRLGEAHGAHFTDELLYMRPDDWTAGVAARKVMGVQHVQALGYRVIAFVDNEPNNLAALLACDGVADMLLLHANTIFLSSLEMLPPVAVQGDCYTLADCVAEEALVALAT